MDYRRFYTMHGICGMLLWLQLIFIQTWLPFHLLAMLFAFFLIWHFRHCRFIQFGYSIAVILLYIFRLLIRYWLQPLSILWYLYCGLLFFLGSCLILISLRLFFG